jgi:hypothetical protein
MPDFETLLNVLPQGTAATAVISVVALILLKFVPAMIREFRVTVQGIVNVHGEALREERGVCREERELFRGEMAALRTTFSDGLRQITDSFAERNEALASRLDDLTEAHKDLGDEVMSLTDRLEA